MQYQAIMGWFVQFGFSTRKMRAIAAPTLLECYIAELATYSRCSCRATCPASRAICLVLFVFSVQFDEQRHKIMAQDKPRCIIFPSVRPDGQDYGLVIRV